MAVVVVLRVKVRRHLAVPVLFAISRAASRPTVAVVAADEGRDLRHSLALVAAETVDGTHPSVRTVRPVPVVAVVVAATTATRDMPVASAVAVLSSSERKCLRWG